MYFQIDNSAVRIAGSCHDFPRELPDIPQWLMDAYSWCEDLILESNPLGNPDAANHLFGDVPLRKQIGTRTWLQLALHWPRFWMISRMHRMKSWAVVAHIPHLLMPLGPGVEVQLAKRAQRESKLVGQLESSADLARILDTIPSDVLRGRILSAMRDLPTERNRVRDSHEAWRRGDFRAVAAHAEHLPVMNTPEMWHAYLQIRNRNWLNTIHKVAQSARRTLIVVGVVHLCGPENLIDLYRQEFGAGIAAVPRS